jgi:hypothetical protein
MSCPSLVNMDGSSLRRRKVLLLTPDCLIHALLPSLP